MKVTSFGYDPKWTWRAIREQIDSKSGEKIGPGSEFYGCNILRQIPEVIAITKNANTVDLIDPGEKFET